MWRRIIPAYAGSTIAPTHGLTSYQDHPRIRGEHGQAWRPSLPVSGSSPHTRGALDDSDQYVIDGRIIPAYAGSTVWPMAGWNANADHPRIRGEHRHGLPPYAAVFGSSPHTRGARRADLAELRLERIIPAYAGSTLGPGVSDLRGADHPRIRGEHALSSILVDDVRGSSPHTRGAHLYAGGRLPRHRIIPAYAGSTGGAV